MCAQKKTEFFDPTSYASLPAEYRMTRAEYARYCGNNPGQRLWRFISSFSPLKNSRHYRYLREWFLHGNLTPAVVVDARRQLIASFTVLDMEKPCQFPVIRVMRERLNLMPGGAHDGQRVTGISSYSADAQSRTIRRWKTFTPIIVECICTSRDLCERINAKIPDSDWQALELGLQQIPQPAQEGLYDIALPPELLE